MRRAGPAQAPLSQMLQIPVSPSRRSAACGGTIARRLVESKQSIPHFYLGAEFVVDRLLAARESLNAEGGPRVSVNDLLVCCTARALADVPGVNAHLVNDEIHEFADISIAIAVATERGLLTPVLTSVGAMSPREIAAATKALVEKTNAGRLERGDLEGGTFTVSNLGMFGIRQFDAIINPPQVAILALGEARPTVIAADGQPTIATVMAANLSCDHRAVDGALGARFLAALKQHVETFDN